ncbi:myb domain protein 15 [Striga asiatica]|uniref:Myb domain protein 15 n=1 Tax=Striga asiatica TaxID=4170 RepID=A0A5A7P4F2_STRAF|nr:myb domain protein 15 [Striga asiatica]
MGQVNGGSRIIEGLKLLPNGKFPKSKNKICPNPQIKKPQVYPNSSIDSLLELLKLFTNFASRNLTKNSAIASKNNAAWFTVLAFTTSAKTLLLSLFAFTTTPTSSSISSATASPTILQLGFAISRRQRETSLRPAVEASGGTTCWI